MKEGWEYIDFKDVYPIKMGKTPPRGDKSSWDEKKETHNKWVSIADISNNEGKIIDDTKEYISDSAAEKINKVSKGSLLMSFKLSIGRMAFAGDDLYTNEAIIAIPESNKYNLRFIYYYLLSYNWLSLTEGNEKVKGATLNKTSIGKIQLPVLSLSEQQPIVDYLDSAFGKIDAMKANAEKALNEAKALFQASLKEMLEPKEGWEEKTIGELTESCLGKMLDKHKNKGDLKPYLRNINVRWDGFDLGDILEMRFEEGEDDRYGIKEGDLIICEGGEPGRCAIWSNQIDNMKIQKALHRVRSKGDITNRFLLFSIMLYSRNGFLENYESGATIKHLTGEALKRIPISYPSLSEQQSIVTTLDSIKSKVDKLQENYNKISQECDALKQAILRQVFE